MADESTDEFEIDLTSKNPLPTPVQPPEMVAFVEAMLSDGMSEDK